MSWVAEEWTGGVETLTGDFGDSTVKTHLTAYFVSLPPRRLGACVLQPVGCHADIEFAFGATHFVCPPVGEDFVIGYFLAYFPVELGKDVIDPTTSDP